MPAAIDFTEAELGLLVAVTNAVAKHASGA